jgi:hypothetical protein
VHLGGHAGASRCRSQDPSPAAGLAARLSRLSREGSSTSRQCTPGRVEGINVPEIGAPGSQGDTRRQRDRRVVCVLAPDCAPTAFGQDQPVERPPWLSNPCKRHRTPGNGVFVPGTEDPNGRGRLDLVGCLTPPHRLLLQGRSEHPTTQKSKGQNRRCCSRHDHLPATAHRTVVQQLSRRGDLRSTRSARGEMGLQHTAVRRREAIAQIGCDRFGRGMLRHWVTVRLVSHAVKSRFRSSETDGAVCCAALTAIIIR